MEDKRFLSRISPFDLMAMAYGAIPLLLVGIMLTSSYIHGDLHEDLNLTRGDFEARFPAISLILHTSTSFLILLFPLHRKLFGILALSFTIITFLCTAYFHQNGGWFILGFALAFHSVCFLLPSLYILRSAFGKK